MKRKGTRIAIRLIALLIAFSSMAVPATTAAAQDTAINPEQRRAMFRRGAQLWPIYCNTCHNARPPSEFSAMEWKMIMMHMRTQANLTGEDAQALLEYLRSAK